MSIESRLKRGDDPKDVAKLFNIDEADAVALQQKLRPKKKAAKKTAKKR